MGMLTVIENLSLDGVAQAPGGAEEDIRGGFAHGGWARRYDDAVHHRVADRPLRGLRPSPRLTPWPAA
jgi:hypothetical protein